MTMFVKRDLDMAAIIRRKYLALQTVLDERARRLSRIASDMEATP